MSFNTPILLIAWRRPQQTQRVIESIRPMRPSHVFVACDGPRPDHAEDIELVEAVKEVCRSEINWPCTIEKRYSKANQGCRIGVSDAVSWFFSNVEEGIILEDDCRPSQEFLPFCSELLERYRDDSRIWGIAGSNFQGGTWRGDGSYYFSRYPHCWGWASWRRCWKHYDSELKSWPALKKSDLMETIFTDPTEKAFWSNTWDLLRNEGEPDTWDYQWCYTVFANGGLIALPNQNLVENIGYGADATHTKTEQYSTKIDRSLGEIVHPCWILRNSMADRSTFKTVFCYQDADENRPPQEQSHRNHWRATVRARLLSTIPKRFRTLARKSLERTPHSIEDR
ncbi:glycosyltransferase family 2 protein [Synechococcus sp. CCY 9618]|uniref:glycosyltransferase family 2 protein n=1 Tax=Synechococcus sp. CCY 9618 TaxID=2815602 RepID=UPI001C23F35B|nr:glycosyltransferase family 2 protein [Synechococcus sp. CCY 9618]